MEWLLFPSSQSCLVLADTHSERKMSGPRGPSGEVHRATFVAKCLRGALPPVLLSGWSTRAFRLYALVSAAPVAPRVNPSTAKWSGGLVGAAWSGGGPGGDGAVGA